MSDFADDLEIPAFLRRLLTDPERPWAPPQRSAFLGQGQTIILPPPVDPETAKFLAEQEAERKIRTQNRIARMLAKKEDHTGERWNSRTAKWEKI